MTPTRILRQARGEYTLANAQAFGWSSLTGDLPEDRLNVIREFARGPRMLDVGCGGGWYVDHLAGMGFEAVGVDKYDMFLDMARRRQLRGTSPRQTWTKDCHLLIDSSIV